MYKFEKLKVWQESIKLIQLCYLVCEQLPALERNILIDQLKRSSVSVALNIAEGSGSEGDREYKRYLYIARKSLFEVIATLKVIENLYRVKPKEAFKQTELVGKMLNGLINTINKTNS